MHTHLWIVGSGNGGMGGGGGDGGGGDRGIDKGPERTSYGSGGGGEGGGSGSYGGGRPQPRARRTQRRVTHNEKRYHSGSAMHYVVSERTFFRVAANGTLISARNVVDCVSILPRSQLLACTSL